MKHKHLLLKLIEKFTSSNPIGVEIGVDHADTTLYLLENKSNLKHLYAIDPYINRDPRYNEVKELLSKYNNCTLIRETSNSAVNQIPDDLDFIFIDGNHTFEAALSDLKNYAPKIKSGGLLTGHDWTSVRSEFGVVEAGGQYLSENADLFDPLFSNEALKDMGLSDFKRGGWHEKSNRHLIHKKRPSAFPLWWVLKK